MWSGPASGRAQDVVGRDRRARRPPSHRIPAGIRHEKPPTTNEELRSAPFTLTTLNSFTLFFGGQKPPFPVIRRSFQIAEQVRPGRSPFHMPTGLADGLGLESSRGIRCRSPRAGDFIPPAIGSPAYRQNFTPAVLRLLNPYSGIPPKKSNHPQVVVPSHAARFGVTFSSALPPVSRELLPSSRHVTQTRGGRARPPGAPLLHVTH